LEYGGSIDGIVEGLNKALDITVPAWLQEGGTYVIPGHGRIADEADLVSYRDLALIVRDRVRASVERGLSLRQVQADRPSLDYDPRYIPGKWTSQMFIESVDRSLARAR